MSMHVVWKYKIPVIYRFEMELPVECNILLIRRQGADACMWIQCDPEAITEKRHFITVGTGHKEIDSRSMKYIDTYFTGVFVWHVYEDIG